MIENLSRQIVMLPTVGESAILLAQGKLYFTGDNKDLPKNSAKNQHLYVLSDEIKEEDYVIDIHDQILKIKNDFKTGYSVRENDGEYKGTFEIPKENVLGKIIASTDKTLHVPLPMHADLAMGTDFVYDKVKGFDEYRKIIPTLSKFFIDSFIKAFNKGKVITKVEVEYEKVQTDEGFYEGYGEKYFYSYNLKIGENNTIIIH